MRLFLGLFSEAVGRDLLRRLGNPHTPAPLAACELGIHAFKRLIV